MTEESLRKELIHLPISDWLMEMVIKIILDLQKKERYGRDTLYSK